MTRTLAVALAVALPGVAPALDWRAHAGFDYARQDRTLTDATSTELTRLEYDLGLDASGYVYAPSTAQWLAAVQWRRLAESLGGQDARHDLLTYWLRTSFFQDPRSPVRLQLQAARTDEDHRSDGAPGSSQATTTSAGADLKLAVPNLPFLAVGYQYLDREETGALLRGADRTVHTLNAATSHGAGTFNYSARYTGNVSTGTYDWDDFDDHRLDLDAQAEVTEGVKARLSDTWYRRVPTNGAGTNLSQEFNALSATVLGQADGRGQQRVGYSYAHALSSAPSILDRERVEQRLSYWDHRIFAGTPWQLYATADASLSEARVGPTLERAAGQLLQLQGLWRRLQGEDLYELRLGPAFGAREPDTGKAEFGHGVTAGGTVQHRWTRLLGSASYDLAYESDLYAASGWSLRQSAAGRLASPLGVGEAAAQVQASALRRDGGVVGPGASRLVTVQASYAWRRHSVMATGSLQEGVSGALGESLRGDGLFLPAPFDTRTSHGIVTGTFGLTDYLWLSLRGRLTATSQPDRADHREQELFASLTWSYAGVFLSLEDRWIGGRVGGIASTENLFVFRVRRAFGSR